MPEPNPLTITQNGSLIASRSCTAMPQSLHLLQWDAHICPKFAHSRGVIGISVYLPHSWARATNHPKRHPDPISRFSIIHRTDRPNDGPGDKTYNNTHLRSINGSDTSNNNVHGLYSFDCK